jgi:hypothetical protein
VSSFAKMPRFWVRVVGELGRSFRNQSRGKLGIDGESHPSTTPQKTEVIE